MKLLPCRGGQGRQVVGLGMFKMEPEGILWAAGHILSVDLGAGYTDGLNHLCNQFNVLCYICVKIQGTILL